MKKNHTSMLFIIDRSGSMRPLADDTIGGFATVLEDNRKVDGTADVTIMLFDHEFSQIADHVDIQEVSPLDKSTYVPRGMTALLDAVGMAVSGEIAHQETLSDDEKPENTLVTIITDGHENASMEWTYQRVKDLLTAVQEERQWVVSFLGANIDATREADNLGIRQGMAANYVADGAGTASAYGSVSKMQRMMRGVKRGSMSAEAYRSTVDSLAQESLSEVRADYERRRGTKPEEGDTPTDGGKGKRRTGFFGWGAHRK